MKIRNIERIEIYHDGILFVNKDGDNELEANIKGILIVEGLIDVNNIDTQKVKVMNGSYKEKINGDTKIWLEEHTK